MKIILLGTGGSAGVPLIGGPDGAGDWGACDPQEPRNRRMRPSIIIESDTEQRLLVDTSPDLRAQLLACRIARVDAILYTHAHADHVTGLDDVRILNRIVNRPLAAYAMANTLAELKTRFGYAFRPWDPPHFYRPVLIEHPIAPGEEYELLDLPRMRAFRQSHGKVESLGLRAGTFGYSTDVIALDDTAFEALAGIDTWVVDCFLRYDPHWTHANLPTVQDWVERLKPRRTILTHMGNDMDWAWMAANLPNGIEAGYDGMVIDIP